MNTLVVLIVIALVVALIVVNMVGGEKPDKRAIFFDKFSKLVGAKFEPIEGYDSSYRVRFTYEGMPFYFEDYEEPGFQQSSFKGYLKFDTGKNFSLIFAEKKRASIRADVQTIGDVSNPWARGGDNIRLPKSLSDLRVSSNRPDVANDLLADDAVIKQFEKYKNVDSRGYPMMSLEINNGTLVLSFHPKPNLKPSLFKLRQNPASLVEHLKMLCILAQKVDDFRNL